MVRMLKGIFGIFVVIFVFSVLLVSFGAVLVGFELSLQEPFTTQVEGLRGEIQIKQSNHPLHPGLWVCYCEGEEETIIGEIGRGSISLFREGKYSMTVDGNTLLIRWPPNSSYAEENWYEKSFTLPVE